MKANLRKHLVFLLIIGLFLSTAACAPKSMINGRVLDVQTERPIKDAAVAIRWYENQSENDSGAGHTFDAVQDLSDENGAFKIPHHPEKTYVMGVYKKGYVTWSSRTTFSNTNETITANSTITHLEDGLEIRLEPFNKGYSPDQHAAFTVLVAGEVAESQKGPFYKAIIPLFHKWRDNLRNEFRKKISNITQ